MKLLLIHPKAYSYMGFGDTTMWGLPPLGLAYVAAVTPKNWKIRIVDEYIEKVDLDEPADLVGISTYSVNATRAYELSDIYRKKGITTVLGGIHASMMYDEAIKYADSVVIGEAEGIWEKVINDFEKGVLKKKYIASLLSLDHLPLPRRDLLSDKYEMDVIQTTRGCPFDCDFCSVSVFNGKKYRHRPVEDVLDELETLKKKLIFFVDDNIVGAGKVNEKRALKLFKCIIDRGIKKWWGSQTSVNIINNERLLYYMKKSGCFILFLGLESPNATVLKELNKSFNIKYINKDFRSKMSTFHKYGISIIGSFLIGSDNDDLSIFDQLFDFIKKSSIDAPLITLLTPLPGTRLYQKYKDQKRIIYHNYPKDWERYDFGQITFRPKNMSGLQLEVGYHNMEIKRLKPLKNILQFFKTLIRTRSIIAASVVYKLLYDEYKIWRDKWIGLFC